VATRQWKRSASRAERNGGCGLLFLIAVLAAAQADAGRRVASVVPGCRSELATLTADVEGHEDRCVASVAPHCAQDESLAPDAQGQADRCQAADVDSRPASTREPECPAGLELEAREGPDACRRADKPTCPSGLTLRTLPGDDICRK
jgi:hypothetical protein